MRKILALALAMSALGCSAEQDALPTRFILPGDVVPESVQLFHAGTNLMVRWTYTEPGAQKMLAFWEAHEGQKVRIVVGTFVSPPSEIMFRPIPPTFSNYAQWKEGWLKYRTDKFFGVSEDDARRIVTGLKNK